MAISVGSKHRWTVLSNLKSSVSQQLLFPNHPLSGYDDVSCDLCPPFSLESFTAKVWDGSKNKAKVMSNLNYYFVLFTFEIRELFHSVGTEFYHPLGRGIQTLPANTTFRSLMRIYMLLLYSFRIIRLHRRHHLPKEWQ